MEGSGDKENVMLKKGREEKMEREKDIWKKGKQGRNSKRRERIKG